MTTPLVKTTKAKAWVAALGTLITVLVAVFADDVFSADEIVSVVGGLVSAVATVLAVYQVPNKPTT